MREETTWDMNSRSSVPLRKPLSSSPSWPLCPLDPPWGQPGRGAGTPRMRECDPGHSRIHHPHLHLLLQQDKGENLGPVGPRRPWQGQPEIKDANGICKLQSQKLVSPALAGKSISAKQEFRDLSRDGDREIQAQLTVTSKVLSLNPDPDTLTPAGTPGTQ
ncbi:small integral membrane protein 47 isoform X2 [Pseudorca crassidens]|uniref:small integral membrane protein 47 isoform X2 n=1 Tax=Pseudorca crassidens TaxID=82174 RepID=UPI00352DB129